MIQTIIFFVVLAFGCILFRNPFAAIGLAIVVMLLINKVWEKMDI